MKEIQNYEKVAFIFDPVVNPIRLVYDEFFNFFRNLIFSDIFSLSLFCQSNEWASEMSDQVCFLFVFLEIKLVLLYLFKQRFYLIGSDRNKRFFRVLKIDRSEPSDLNISEDPVVYSPHEIKSLLQRIAEGNRATGGLTFVAKVFGIAG